MEFITIELTANAQAIILKTNSLILSPEIDYDKVIIPLSSICHIIQEENSNDGINIMMVNDTKYSINPNYITMIGSNDYKLLPSYICPNNDTLVNDILALVGW